MPVLLPILMIAAIFMVIRTHSALFPVENPKKSAAVRYGEAFEELLKKNG